jgi:methylthioribose-1-phosphate isomerase
MPSSDRTEPQRIPDATPPPDLGRRLFFRRLAGDVVAAAGNVIGVAQLLQQESAEAARELLGGDVPLPDDPSRRAAPLPAGGFRPAFRWDDDALYVVDQRLLPEALAEHRITSAYEAVHAIRELIVRGAPAIGQVAAIGIALSMERLVQSRPFARRASLRGATNALRNARPTAVNLGWAMDRMLARYEAVGGIDAEGQAVADALRDEAAQLVHESTTDHGRLAEAGLGVLPVIADRPLKILTHCNTGPLACGEFGTALGVVQAAHHEGRDLHVWVDETRPVLQGARLTTWELAQAGVPHTLIADSAAATLLARGDVDVILVGADRVAANGDTANKLGTYPLAVVAARHGVPFYVCAPTSTLDPATPDGASIQIEERPPDEVLRVRGVPIAPPETPAFNPAFDVTPAELITGIVTDEGVLRAPFGVAIQAAVAANHARWAAAPRIGDLMALARGMPAPRTALPPDEVDAEATIPSPLSDPPAAAGSPVTTVVDGRG